MKLINIQKLTGTLELVSGLHIGSGNTEMHIGGTDNPVIKHPLTQQPYIRSLLEWEIGVVGVTDGKPLGFKHLPNLDDIQQQAARNLLRLFGGAPEGANQSAAVVAEIGPTRLAFWDCSLEPGWIDDMNARNLLLTENKSENMIDRIRGVAEHPRNTERVPAGARFAFNLTLRVHDEDADLLPLVWRGLKLLELTGLGGSGSRGYGKVAFTRLELEGQDVLGQVKGVRFESAA